MANYITGRFSVNHESDDVKPNLLFITKLSCRIIRQRMVLHFPMGIYGYILEYRAGAIFNWVNASYEIQKTFY